MIFIMTVVISFVASVLMKNTRIVGAAGFFVLAWLAGSADARTTTDYGVYQTHYNALGLEVSPFEKGYTWLSTIFKNQGVSYQEFRLYFVLLAFVILYIGVLMFTKNIAMFTWVYGVTVYFNDATQVRNLMMIALVVLGMGIFTTWNVALGKVIGSIVILISSQFHDLGFFFFMVVPLFFVPKDFMKKISSITIGVSAFFALIISVFGNGMVTTLLVRFLTIFSSRSASSENVEAHFSRGTSLSVLILIWVSVLVVWRLSILFAQQLDSNVEFNGSKTRMLIAGMIVSILTLFLILMSPDYSRISRNAFLFFIILATMYFTNKSNKIVRVRGAKILFVLTLILMAYTHTMIWGNDYQKSIPYIAQLKDSNIISGE